MVLRGLQEKTAERWGDDTTGTVVSREWKRVMSRKGRTGVFRELKRVTSSRGRTFVFRGWKRELSRRGRSVVPERGISVI